MSPPARRFCRDGSWAFSICGRQLLGRLVFTTPVLHMLLGLTSTSQCSAGFDGCADAVVAARHRPERGFVLAEGGKADRGSQGQGEQMRGWRRGESLQQTSPAIANHVSQLQASPSVCSPLFILLFTPAVPGHV